MNQMGETWDVEGLYLADTSVVLAVLGVSPMVTGQAIVTALRNLLLKFSRGKKSN